MIGALRHPVEFLAPAPAPDAGGGVALSFESRGADWAGLERRPAARAPEPGRRALRRRIALTIRMRRDVAIGWRVRLAEGEDETDYEIVSIEDGEGRARLLLIGEEALS